MILRNTSAERNCSSASHANLRFIDVAERRKGAMSPSILPETRHLDAWPGRRRYNQAVRAEDEDRLIAALPRLRDGDAREPSGARLRDPRHRFVLAGANRPQRGVLCQRGLNGTVQGQRFLGRSRRGNKNIMARPTAYAE